MNKLCIWVLLVATGLCFAMPVYAQNFVEHDIFPDTNAQIRLIYPDGSFEWVELNGPTAVDVTFDGTNEGDANDGNGNSLDEVATEIVSMNLTGISLLGPLEVRQNPDPGFRSFGEIEEVTNNTPGVLDVPPFTGIGEADSFFDVFFEIETVAGVLHTEQPKHMMSVIRHKPPEMGNTYENPAIIPLLLPNGNPSGFFIGATRHTPNPPFIEIDMFPSTIAQIELIFPGGGSGTAVLTGPTKVRVSFDDRNEGDANDDNGNGLDEVATEMVDLNLSGSSPLGPLQVRQNPDPNFRSFGEIEEVANNTPGVLDVPPFTGIGEAESFFDVFFEIELPDGLILHTETPKHMTSRIRHKPPETGNTYENPEIIPLLYPNGAPTGFSIGATRHTPAPLIEIDVFPSTKAEIELISGTGTPELIQLRGPTTTHVYFEGLAEGDANDDDGDGLDEVATEIVSMNLTGASSMGPLEVRQHPRFHSTGRMRDLTNDTPGVLDVPPFVEYGMVYSFFDVYFEIETTAGVLHTEQPKRMNSVIRHKPPGYGEMYENPEIIPLLFPDGTPSSLSIGASRHIPRPLTDPSKIAVTDPWYDDIGAILNSMGIGYTEIQDSDLANYGYISQFEVIFINCSDDCEIYAPAAGNSLEQFVREGGYIYASDWAYIYVVTSFPGRISFYEPPKIGVGDRHVQASIVDPGLAEYLGGSVTDIYYDLDIWVPILGVGPKVKVYLTGEFEIHDLSSATAATSPEPGQVRPPISREPSFGVDELQTMSTVSGPLAVSFTHGEGKVVFTTFHNEPQISEDVRKLMEYLVLIPYTGGISDELADFLRQNGHDIVAKENLGTINQGQTSAPFTFNNPFGQIAFGANWPGSVLKLSVYGPDGSLYEEKQSDQPPLMIEVPQAEAGDWTYTMTGMDVPNDNYPYVIQVATSEGTLDTGWNLFSFSVNKCFYEGTPPTQPACVEMVDVVNDLGFGSMSEWFDSIIVPVNQVTNPWRIVIGTNGVMDSTLSPSSHSLKYMTVTAGYWVKIEEAAGSASLSLSGALFDPVCVIPLLTGWSIVSYPLSTGYYDTDTEPDVPGVTNWVKVDRPVGAHVFASIAGKYRIVIGQQGVYDPTLSPASSSLRWIAPFDAFWLKMNDPWDLVYGNMGTAAVSLVLVAPPTNQTVRRSGIMPTNTLALVYGSVSQDGIEADVGAHVQVFTQSGVLCGQSTVSHKGIYEMMLVYGDDEHTPQIEGAQLGEELVFHVNGAPAQAEGDVHWLGDKSIQRVDLAYQGIPHPQASMLGQNYPNPFNPETWIPYQLKEDSDVVIRIYTSTGQLVRTLSLGRKPAGFYADKERAAYWDGQNDAGESVSSGVYFYQIRADSFTSIRKAAIMR